MHVEVRGEVMLHGLTEQPQAASVAAGLDV
jgi:hypothetical protein